MKLNKTMDSINIAKLYNKNIIEWIINFYNHDDTTSSKIKWEENYKKLTEIKDIFNKHVIKAIKPEKYTLKNMFINEERAYEVSFYPVKKNNHKVFIIIKKKKDRFLVKELYYEATNNVFDIRYVFDDSYITINQVDSTYYSHKKINKKDWYKLIRKFNISHLLIEKIYDSI